MSSLTRDRVLQGSDVLRWIQRARAVIGTAAEDLDGIDAVTSRDGDAGTNLRATLTMAAQAAQTAHNGSDQAREACGCGDLEGVPAGLVLTAAARGALLGAHGRLGSIMSQLLRGLGDAAGCRPGIDASTLARGFTRAEAEASAALADPESGTILTVVRAAAEAAEMAVFVGERSLEGVVVAARSAAEAALDRTATPPPDPTGLVAEAGAEAGPGVVDAGGLAFLLVLDALESVVSQQLPPDPHARLRAYRNRHRPDVNGATRVVVLAWAPSEGLEVTYRSVGWLTWSQSDDESIRLTLERVLSDLDVGIELVVLPNDADVAARVEAARGELVREDPSASIRVIPSHGHPQAVAGLAAWAAALSEDDEGGAADAMAAAVATTSWTAIRPATEELVRLPEIVVEDGITLLVDHMMNDPRVPQHMLVLLGDGCPAPIGRILKAAVLEEVPHLQVSFIQGGMTDCLVALGVR